MKLHVNLFLVLLACLMSAVVLANPEQIAQLEKELKRAKGQKLMRGAIQLADLYAGEGNYNKSLEWLDKACREAKRGRRDATIAQINLAKAERIVGWPANEKHLRSAIEAVETSLDQEVTSLEDRQLSVLNALASKIRNRDLSRRVQSAINGIYTRQKEIALLNQQEQQKEEFDEFRNQSEAEKFEVLKSLQEGLESTSQELTEITARSRQEYQRQRAELAKTRSILDETEIEKDSLFYELLNYQDSMLAFQATELELQQKELALQNERLQTQELQLENQRQRRNALILAGLAVFVFLISLFLYMRYQTASQHSKAMEAKNLIIRTEKQKSDDLLRNILPARVAEELKENGFVQTQYFDSASVLFADFVKFSKIAQNISPQKLIEDLHYCFGKFDEIMLEHEVEKIKTIGDSYMCVAGVPNVQQDHAPRIIRAAKEMQAFLEIWNVQRKEDDLPLFNVRIGIHSGPVIAGVVGKSKFVYDIWGETVNIADRMQESGIPGEINISLATQQLLNGDFKTEYRGKLQIKNMADMDGYLVRV